MTKNHYVLMRMRADDLSRLLKSYEANRIAIESLHDTYITQLFRDFKKIYKEKTERWNTGTS